MSFTFKAKCVDSKQDADGSHTASFKDDTGEQATISSKEILFEVGSEYSFTVDGKVSKPLPKPPAEVAEPKAKPKKDH